MSDDLKLRCLEICNGDPGRAKGAYQWLMAGTTDGERTRHIAALEKQRDELFAETRRAQTIIDGYRPYIQLVQELASYVDPMDTANVEAELECFGDIIRKAKSIAGDLSDEEAEDDETTHTATAPSPPPRGDLVGGSVQKPPGETSAPGYPTQQDKADQIPEGFTKWEGGVVDGLVDDEPEVNVEVFFRGGSPLVSRTRQGRVMDFEWGQDGGPDDIIAYRVIADSPEASGTKAPSPEQEVCEQTAPHQVRETV